MSIRELTEDEIALVAGGNNQPRSIIEFPPPTEPEIPPLPGVLPGIH